MEFLICLAIVGLMFWVFPKGVKFLFVAPLVGIAAGGFGWGIAAMIWSSLITLKTFAFFLTGGIVVSEIVAFLTE